MGEHWIGMGDPDSRSVKLARAFTISVCTLGVFLNVVESVYLLLLGKKRSNTETILLSLSLNDALFCGSVVAWSVLFLVKNDALASYFTALLFGLLVSSILHLFVLTLDRFVAVKYPYRYKVLVTPTRLVGSLVCLWSISVTLLIVECVLVVTNTSIMIVSDVNIYAEASLLFSGSLLLLFAYAFIIMEVRKSTKNLSNFRSVSSTRKREDLRLVITSCAITFTLCACAVPYAIVILAHPIVSYYLEPVGCFNMLCNSVVYFYRVQFLSRWKARKSSSQGKLNSHFPSPAENKL